MQNSSEHMNASLNNNTRENQTISSNVVDQGFVPASMVQNILEWQTQALETIREQNKANQATQQQNNALLQRIDTLQQYIHKYKQDTKILDLMDIDNVNTEAIEDIKENHGDNQSIKTTRRSPSNDALLTKDNVSLRQSSDTEIERYKKALKDLDNEWRDKYAQLQNKYDAQQKAYQELKEHYQKRSAEWKRVKKWLDEQKFLQKNPERTDQVNDLTSKMTKSKVQFEKSPTIVHERDSPFSNNSKTNSSGALADVTNMQNRTPSQTSANGVTNEHLVNVNKARLLGSSYNKYDNIVFHQDSNRYTHNINLFSGLMIKNNLKTNYCPDSNPISCDQEWNEDHKGQPDNFDHDMTNLNSEEKDNLFPSEGNKKLRLLEGTAPEHAINLEEGNYGFLLGEDPLLNKKRTAETVAIQENAENDELSSTEVTNKRYKPLSSKSKSKLRKEINEFDYDDDDDDDDDDDAVTKTPYSNRFKIDSRESDDDMYDDNNVEDANLLTPITPTSIKNKGVEKEPNDNNNTSKQGEGYRYIETTRKRTERRQLMAQDCRDCRKYYEMTGISLSRQCDHNQSPEDLIQGRKQMIGRHRAKYSRPQTPPGFWKVGFPTSQEIAEINELSVAYEREREEQKRKEMEFAKSRERKWDSGTSK